MNVTVNGITLEDDAIERESQHHAHAQDPTDTARRLLAVRELLLQRARCLGIEQSGSGRDSEDAVIERVLEAEVSIPTPTRAECQRYYDNHPTQFISGELVEASHLLIAVTPGAPVASLRARAESLLAQLRADPTRFAEYAREASNCPSGQQGGTLDQFGRGQMVPEFEKAVFGTAATGVLPTLVQTRYGFHIVLIAQHVPGRRLDFEAVHQRIEGYLASQVQARALMQYVRVLAGQARINGVDLDAAVTPLLQ